jgi:hypothetical protein
MPEAVEGPADALAGRWLGFELVAVMSQGPKPIAHFTTCGVSW